MPNGVKINVSREEEIERSGRIRVKKILPPGAAIYDRLIFLFLAIPVFLIPLFFLPWTVEVLETNKLLILIFCSILAFLFWLAKVISQRKLEFAHSFLNIAALVFGIVYLAAAIFSQDRLQSFLGSFNQLYTSFLAIFCFLFFYFVFSQQLCSGAETIKFILIFLASAVIVLIFGLLQMFSIFLLPFGFAKSQIFNPIGTVNHFGIFAILIFSLAMVLSLAPEQKKTQRIIFGAIAVLAILPLILINFWVLWLGLTIGLVLILAVIISRTVASNQKLLMFPMAVLSLAILFLIVRFPLPWTLPSEITLNQRASWQIAKQALENRPLLGSGPSNFVLDYARFRSPDINQTVFWNIRFNKPSSEMMNYLATTGAIGTVAWLALVVLGIYCCLKFLIKTPPGRNFSLMLGIFSGFVSLIILSFFYTSNIVLTFLFWFFLGIIAAFNRQRMITLALDQSPRLSLLMSFVFMFVTVLGISFLFLVGQGYAAEIYFQKAFNRDQQGASSGETSGYLARAAQLNRYRDVYLRNLAQAHLLQFQQFLAQPATEQTTNQMVTLADLSIREALAAKDLNPRNVANWSILGAVYQTIFVRGADEQAIKAWEQAINLEPNNPYLYTELGRTYLLKAGIAEQKERAGIFKKAMEYFQKALALKADYLPAHFQIAMAYAQEGKIKEALVKMEENKRLNFRDTGVAFQLGLLYYQDGQKDKALIELERVIQLAPNFSNARWYLASLYEERGRIKDAIEQIEKVAELNPDNKVVQDKLRSLRKGALQPPPPLPQPVGEGMKEK